MQTLKKFLALLIITVVFSGCANIQIKESSKLIGYDYKLRSVAVVYKKPSFDDYRLMSAFDGLNFGAINKYFSDNVASVFKDAGVTATYIAEKARTQRKRKTVPKEKDSQAAVSGRELDPLKASSQEPIPSGPVLFILPRNAKALIGDRTGPKSITVDVDVFLLDQADKKKMWQGEFSISGTSSSNFTEQQAKSFLMAIIGQMQNDGLIDKPAVN